MRSIVPGNVGTSRAPILYLLELCQLYPRVRLDELLGKVDVLQIT